MSYKRKALAMSPEAKGSRAPDGRYRITAGNRLLGSAAGPTPAWERAYWQLAEDRRRAEREAEK